MAGTGECMLLVDGQEPRLRAWDFVHCPPNTEHGFAGLGDGRCVIVGTGARAGWAGEGVVYLRSELALRHGDGVESETSVPADAYAQLPKWKPSPPESWEGFPWG